MKNLLAIALISASLVACDNAETNETTEMDDTTTTTTTTSTYTPADGDASYRNGTLMVYRDNTWVEADEDVRMDNNVTVYRNGEVKRNDEVVELRDGEVVNRSGQFFDNTGRAIEDAWDATKRGVKKAGESVENAAQKVGDKIDGNDNN